jgi:hypothetical protein
MAAFGDELAEQLPCTNSGPLNRPQLLTPLVLLLHAPTPTPAPQVTQALQQRVWSMRVAPGEQSRKPQLPAVLSAKLSETASAASSYDMLAPDGSLTARTVSGAGSSSRQPGSYSTLGDDRSSTGGLRSRECSFSTGPSMLQEQHKDQPGIPQDTHTQPDQTLHITQQQQQQQLQGSKQQAGILLLGPSASGGARPSSGSTTQQRSSAGESRLLSAGSVLVRRLSQLSRRATLSGQLLPVTQELRDMQELQLSVRIGIATGSLPYGSDVACSSVKHRAKGE